MMTSLILGGKSAKRGWLTPIPSLREKPLLLLMFYLLGVNLTPARGQELAQSITMAVTPTYQGFPIGQFSLGTVRTMDLL